MLFRSLGQQVVVENTGGVGGALGVQKVLSAPADGYQLVLGSPMELMLAPLALSAVKYKPEDFYDDSLVKELDESGFLDGLYKR